MSKALSISEAAHCLRHDGVIAIATESVWGLSCDPSSAKALEKLIAIKKRSAQKGFIIIAADFNQVLHWINQDALSQDRLEHIQSTWPGAHTWLMPPSAAVLDLCKGQYETIAVRISAHPDVQKLAECMPYGMTSTSCNFSNQAAPSTFEEVDKNLLAMIDGYVPSIVSGNPQPSRIQDSQSLTFIR